MIKNECVSKCLLQCLEQTESKYGESLVHSDDLTKHSVLVMWKISQMKKICPLFFCQIFCQKLSITLFTDSLLENATVVSWVYSQPIVRCCAVSCCQVLDLPRLPRKSQNVRIQIFTDSIMILLLYCLMFS